MVVVSYSVVLNHKVQSLALMKVTHHVKNFRYMSFCFATSKFYFIVLLMLLDIPDCSILSECNL